MMYGGKPLSTLSDRALATAETDVANCLLRAYAAPETAPVQVSDDGAPVTDRGRYGVYFARMSELADAIAAEKAGRAGRAR